MKCSTFTLIAAAFTTLSAIGAEPNGAPVRSLERFGPYGHAWSDANFDDTNNFPLTAVTDFSILCKSGDRLDYIELGWSDGGIAPFAKMAHGNFVGGSSEQFINLPNSEEITSITVYVCTGKRNKGKICGVEFGIHNRPTPFACGVLNAGGAQTTLDFGNKYKFFALFGSTQNNLKTITKLGFIVSKPE